MVNKAAVGLLGIVVVASLGVGVLIGMQLGGTPPAEAGPQDGTSATSPNADDDGGGSATAEPATATERRTTIPARQFQEGTVADYIVQFVNEERQARNATKLSTGGSTADTVRRMAANHSVAMADNGTAGHEVNGVDTADRYRNFDLFDRCQFESPHGSYISRPDDSFESVGSTVAGKEYRDGGETAFNADERDVARAIVDEWLESSDDRNGILSEGPTRLGVGVEITSGGTVYAAANVCA